MQDTGHDKSDAELFTFIRETYFAVNKYYLREQAIQALVASGYNREEAELKYDQAYNQVAVK